MTIRVAADGIAGRSSVEVGRFHCGNREPGS